MLIVGLTGGVACGKSTAMAFLREWDAHVIDLDQIVHERKFKLALCLVKNFIYSASGWLACVHAAAR